MAAPGGRVPRSLFSNLTSAINVTVPVDQLCQPFCDPLNDSGYCLTLCLDYCPDVCHSSFLSYVPPLPSPSIDYSPEVSTGGSHQSSPLSLLLFMIFAAISVAFLVTGIYGLLVWARRRRRVAGPGPGEEFLQRDVEIREDEFLDEDRGPIVDHPIWYIRTVGLDASVIDAIAVCRYKRGEGLVEGTDCSVCLSEFQEDETLRLLPKCSHAFHVQCIDTWLQSRTNCPVCRAPILSGGQQRVPDPILAGNPEDTVLTNEATDHESSEGDDFADNLRESGRMELDDGRNMQRSASDDSLSAAKISVAASNEPREGDPVIGLKNAADLDQNLVTAACRNLSSSSSASSSSSIRRTRSLSWSGRFLSTAARHGRNRTAILPL
ncbi:hypothetical protein MLD38_026724 [Melastoma candidum]|uniref:Uncharacterized protein n=1 Tax=Melastoma candidum TaxID=119954 RepID=A0ACB9P2P4_9MYRT|nr:hypothetical protein MLD38_026724 [Melastoma candidum]